MKKEIIKILEQNAKEGWNGDVEAVGYVDFESVAEQLVKLFAIPDVSNRRELLRDKEVKCFDDFLELYCEKKDNGKWLYRDSLWSFNYIIDTYQELYKNP